MDRIDPACERLRPLADYCRRLPSGRAGKRLNRATLWRWALRGMSDGRRLRTASLGGTRVTCDAWIWEFLNRTQRCGPTAKTRMGMPEIERGRIAQALGVATKSPAATGPR